MIEKDVIDQYEQYKSTRKLSEIFGVSRQRISSILKKNNIQLYVNHNSGKRV